MASAPEVERAVRGLVERFGAVDPEVRKRYAVDRTISCAVSDLGVVWSARLCEQGLSDVTCEDTGRAQVRLVMTSDDLVAVVEGRLAAPTAWAVGRLRVQAGPMDLLRLRALL